MDRDRHGRPHAGGFEMGRGVVADMGVVFVARDRFGQCREEVAAEIGIGIFE